MADHRWRTSIGAAAAMLALAVVANPAAATSTFEWQLTGIGNSSTQTLFDAVGPATEDILARGYYSRYSDGTGLFLLGSVASWSGGTGVFASDDSGSPNHAVDNYGEDNYLLIEFDSDDYALTAFQIGWAANDSDVEVWIGGSTLAGLSLNGSSNLCTGPCDRTDLASLGFTSLGVFEDVVVNAWNNVNTDITGRYVLFAGQYGESNDFFKLSGIRGQISQVPEPGSLLLLASGLVGLLSLWLGCMRRLPMCAKS